MHKLFYIGESKMKITITDSVETKSYDLKEYETKSGMVLEVIEELMGHVPGDDLVKNLFDPNFIIEQAQSEEGYRVKEVDDLRGLKDKYEYESFRGNN